MENIKIVADSKIPYLKGVLEPFAEVVYLSPDKIDAAVVKDADALIIRTRTHCNKQLLEGSKVKMIATATIGYDHIDRGYCAEAGIKWQNAPGCNAASVAQYVLASLSLLALRDGFTLKGKTIGIVGVGNVGKAVEKECRDLGLNILRCDPPRAEAEGADGFVSLDTVAHEADIITFHTPLICDGKYPTYHLANEEFFNQLAKKPIFINASRGEVVDEQALKQANASGLVGDLIIDCWENEPHIDLELLKDAFIATPHIAGYSADGKSNATRMAVSNIANFFGWNPDLSGIQPPAIEPSQLDAAQYPNHMVEELILNTYDPRVDTKRLRQSPETFEKQRGDYPLRREYRAFTVTDAQIPDTQILSDLGFKVIG